MTLAFFNNLCLKHGGLFQFENNQFYLVAIRPNSWKNTKSFGSHRFIYTLRRSVSLLTSASNFVKFSNYRCRYTANGNFAILLFLMQRVMGYLMALQDFDF